MYDATTRQAYAQLFKLAEAKLPTYVRDATLKVANAEPVIAQALLLRWRQS